MRHYIAKSLFALCSLSIAFVFTACSEDFPLDLAGMFSPQGETIDTRFAQSMSYNDSVGEIHLNMQQNNYTIYLCSDSHITRTRHALLSYFIQQYEAAASPKLAIHLGDLIDAQKNYACADSILNLSGRSINDTLFITPGNHDIYYWQWPLYRELFGTSVYWFDTNNGTQKLDLFICLDSAEGELGQQQMTWLRNLLEAKAKEYRHVIVFSHTHMWKLDASQETTSNMALEATYEFTSMLAKYGVDYYWSGHQHARQNVLYKGVRYIVLDATKDTERHPSYAIAHMSDHVDIEFVPYPEQ